MVNLKIPKSLALPATALIPSVSMALGTNYIDLESSKQNILKGVTIGLLVAASILLIPDAFKSPKGRIMVILGFITSLALINISNLILKKSKVSILASLYFDSLSDGLLLGTLFQKVKQFDKIRPLLIPMSIEMALTGSNTAKILNEESESNAKLKTTFASIILAVSIVIGAQIGKYINENFIIGFGAASMLWLALQEFLPSILKSNNPILSNLSIYVGIIVSFFME